MKTLTKEGEGGEGRWKGKGRRREGKRGREVRWSNRGREGRGGSLDLPSLPSWLILQNFDWVRELARRKRREEGTKQREKVCVERVRKAGK